MKKIFLIFFLTLFFSVFSSAYAGLVPCGLSADDPDQPGDQTVPCTLCHFFVMIDNIIDFLLIKIVPALAVLMIAIGGGMYILSRGDPGKLGRAKELFTAIAIGLVIIYSAFLIIGVFLWSIGLADWTSAHYRYWWEDGLFIIRCQ